MIPFQSEEDQRKNCGLVWGVAVEMKRKEWIRVFVLVKFLWRNRTSRVCVWVCVCVCVCISVSLFLPIIYLSTYYLSIYLSIIYLSSFYLSSIIYLSSIYQYLFGEIYFKELPRAVVEAGRLVTQERVDTAVQVQRQSRDRISSCWGDLSLFPLKAFNWLDEAHLHYGL